MCRHLAWLGAPRSLGELLLQPEHGLLVQSYAPRRQRHGRMNADGWGVGFFAAGAAGAGPLAVEPAAVERCVLRVGGAGDLRRPACWPRCARPRPECRSTRPPPRRSSPAGGCCRTTASSTGRCSARIRPRSRCATPRSWRRTCSTSARSGPASSSPTLGKRDPGARLNLLLTDGAAGAGDPVERHAQRPARPTTASSSRASPTTTTRAGPTSPTTTSSTSRRRRGVTITDLEA